MVIGAVVCLCLALLIGGSGLLALTRRSEADVTAAVMRLVAPVQLAAAVMLAAGAAVALLAPAGIGGIALILGSVGAVATIAAGSWQGARYAARRQAALGSCDSGGCTGCAQVCRR